MNLQRFIVSNTAAEAAIKRFDFGGCYEIAS